MALDEALFERAHRWFVRRLRREDPDCVEWRVELAGIERRLGNLASLLAGRMIEISATGDHGGIGRDRLYLPAAIDWAPTRDDNIAAYLLRTALGVAALGRGLTAGADHDAGGPKPPRFRRGWSQRGETSAVSPGGACDVRR